MKNIRCFLNRSISKRDYQLYGSTTTDYCGNVISENGIAKQLLTEEGYVSLSDNKYHYYLKDHQGNNRVVINQTGAVEETNHYYLFGGVFAGTRNVQPFKYNGKEYDAKKGLNWYDYGARRYDAGLGRFHTNDRFAEKYYSLSAYQYGANNPVTNIDVNGDSIVVLNLGSYNKQHMAMLIQNSDFKWQYYSVNGNNVYVSGKFSGGREFDDLAVGEFNSPQEFLESSYNSAGAEDDKSINSYGFPEGYVIPTSAEQDNKIRTTFTSISQNEEYNLLGNNCTTIIQRAMEAGGIKTYKESSYSYRIPANHSLGEPSFTVKYSNNRPIVPANSFRSIIQVNPSGRYYIV